MLFVPFLYYLFVLRNSNRKLAAALPFVILGYLAAMLLIPGSPPALKWFGYALVPFEAALIVYGLLRLRNWRRQYRATLAEQSGHVADSLLKSTSAAFGGGKLAAYAANELTILYYAYASWRTRRYEREGTAAFTYHTNSIWPSTLLIVGKIIVLESIGLHFLISQWSHLAAWLLTSGDVYLLSLLIADYRAIRLNPVLVGKETVRIRYGLRIRADIQIDDIESVDVSREYTLSKEEQEAAVTPVFEAPNVLIRCHRPVATAGMFGIRKTVSHIYLKLDHASAFQKEVETVLQNRMEQNLRQ